MGIAIFSIYPKKGGLSSREKMTDAKKDSHIFTPALPPPDAFADRGLRRRARRPAPPSIYLNTRQARLNSFTVSCPGAEAPRRLKGA